MQAQWQQIKRGEYLKSKKRLFEKGIHKQNKCPGSVTAGRPDTKCRGTLRHSWHPLIGGCLINFVDADFYFNMTRKWSMEKIRIWPGNSIWVNSKRPLRGSNFFRVSFPRSLFEFIFFEFLPGDPNSNFFISNCEALPHQFEFEFTIIRIKIRISSQFGFARQPSSTDRSQC